MDSYYLLLPLNLEFEISPSPATLAANLLRHPTKKRQLSALGGTRSPVAPLEYNR